MTKNQALQKLRSLLNYKNKNADKADLFRALAELEAYDLATLANEIEKAKKNANRAGKAAKTKDIEYDNWARGSY